MSTRVLNPKSDLNMCYFVFSARAETGFLNEWTSSTPISAPYSVLFKGLLVMTHPLVHP